MVIATACLFQTFGQRLFRLALFTALATLAIFIGFTFFDVLYR